MEVIGVIEPVGRLTMGVGDEFVLVKSVES
jgi:hypothetical protein